MSETSKSKKIPTIPCNYVVCGNSKDNKLSITEGKTQIIDDVPGIPMEIEPGDFSITNETEDGKTKVVDKKTGKLIGYLDADGTLNRKLSEIDKKKAREEGMEH